MTMASVLTLTLAVSALCGVSVWAWKNSTARAWYAVALCAMLASTVLQRNVEKRRVEEHLTWSDPQSKDPLETSLMVLGSFRGLMADVLWVRASRLQESSRYYELKLLCELIQRLQPNFISVYAFQAHNMTYNLAGRALNADDQWYWTQSGLAILERGLERNKHHYGLWFELGWQYLDRINDNSKPEWVTVRQRELPYLDDLTEAEREKVFLDPQWKNRKTRTARNDECLRWAAYYFYKATLSSGDALSLRTERIFGNCLDMLRHFRASKPPGERLHWDDWGSEDWWVELRSRNEKRGIAGDLSTDENLKWCLFQQISRYQSQAEKAAPVSPEKALAFTARARDAEKRFYAYFPNEKRPMTELIEAFTKREELLNKMGGRKHRTNASSEESRDP
jgi:hypothetical protein